MSFFNAKIRSVCLSKLVLVGVCTGFLVLTLLQSVGLTANSKVMPLAEKSLLLDGWATGNLIVVVGERGHILVSKDQGRTWQQQNVPTQVTLTSVFFVDSANGWAAGHGSVILRTEDGGQNWRKVYSNLEDERPILDLWFSSREHGYAAGGYGLFLETTDGGESWRPVDFSPTALIVDEVSGNDWKGEEEWIDFHFNDITSISLDRIFVSAEAGNIYRSDDKGRSWLSLPSPYEGSFYGSLPLHNSNILIYGLRGHLFFTEDAGASWTPVETGVQATLNDGIRLQDGRIVLAGLAGTLLVSADEGKTFELHAQSDRAGIAKILETNDNALILIGEHGVKRLPLPAAKRGASQ